MKTLDLVISILLIPVDYAMIVAAGLASYFLRYQDVITQVRPVFFNVSLESFLPLMLLIALLGVVVFAWSGLYKISTTVALGAEFRKLFFGVSTMLLIVIITVFFRREVFSSRFIIITAWILAILFTFFGRLIIYWIKGKILTHSKLGYNVAMIGSGPAARAISNYYQANPHLGRKIIKEIEHLHDNAREQLEKIHEEKHIDELLVISTDSETMEWATNFSNDFQVTLKYLATYQQSQLINFHILSIGGYPVLEVDKTPLEGWGRIVKRALDIIFSLLVLIVLSPVFLIVAVLIAVDSPGPIIIKLQRVGQSGKIFSVYKFRSMIRDAQSLKNELLKFNERSDGPLFKMQDDPRITRVGRWLRRSSLDELPQFWNVLKGDMSIVGPRPHEPQEVSQYVRPYRKLLTVKPGITGAAQISGRSRLRFEDEAQLDLLYIEKWSILADLRIIVKTPKAILNFHDAA